MNIIKKYFKNSDLNFVLCLFAIFVIYIAIIKKFTKLHEIILMSPMSFILNNVTFYVLAAAQEEALFRFVPLVIALEKKYSNTILFIISFISSIIFAIAHGTYWEIFSSGVFGMFMCAIFIGLNKKKTRYLLSFITITLIHSFFNIGALYGSFLAKIL